MSSIRLRLASWLAPELASYKSKFHDEVAEGEANSYTITMLRREIEKGDARVNELTARLAPASLRITVLRDALKRALPYVQDAHDAVTAEIGGLSPKSKKLPALQATASAVWSDVVAVRTHLQPEASK